MPLLKFDWIKLCLFGFLLSLQSVIPAKAGKTWLVEGDVSWRQIPKEPGWNTSSYRGWEVMSIPGLVSTFYDLDQNGELDYMVIRKILRKTSAEEVTLDEAISLARHDNLSLYISHPVIYFTNRYPLFYCRGLDYRHNCQNMWVDLTEDGLNGNETLYTLSKPTPYVR